MDSIVTKRGDSGTTGLLYGGRVDKDDLRTEAYGALDEAISALGLARASAPTPADATTIESLQRELFTAGAELATDRSKRQLFLKHFSPIGDEHVARLDAAIAALEDTVVLPKAFVIPGGNQYAAAIDLGRSTIRRVERWTVKLDRSQALSNPTLLQYFNRLSDYLFLLARQAEGHDIVQK